MYEFFCCEWYFMLQYEKHSVGAFCSPDTLVKLPQFIGKRSLPGEFFVSRYEVSILLRHPGYRVDKGIGLHVCYDICVQR